MVLIVTDCLAISTSTGKMSPSLDCSLMVGIVSERKCLIYSYVVNFSGGKSYHMYEFKQVI